MTVELATKTCSACGKEKPLSEFHRTVRSRDGHHGQCKPCHNARTTARQAQRRKEMGEEAWLELQRTIVRKSRERRGYDTERLRSRVTRRATALLIERHQSEFDALLRLVRYEMTSERIDEAS